MTWVICKTGETHSGHATVTPHRAGTTVVIMQVPADICGTERQPSHVTFRTLTQPSPERERAPDVTFLCWLSPTGPNIICTA
ncbi:MAG: hypothetical protein RLZZ09_446 [Pseudomonadota bacterium]|jgi:hypothetical protein